MSDKYSVFNKENENVVFTGTQSQCDKYMIQSNEIMAANQQEECFRVKEN